MKQHTAMRIAQVIYNAACRRFEAVVEFFTPGLAQPLRVAVRVSAGQDLGHRQLVLALRREAVRRGIGPL